MVPRAVLMKSGLVSINTARQVNAAYLKTTVNAARSMSYLSKITHSNIKRPIHKNTTFKNSNVNQRFITVKGNNFNTARPKAIVNAVKGYNSNAINASAFWVWKPKHKVLDHVSKQNSTSITMKMNVMIKKEDNVNSTNNVNTVSSTVNVAGTYEDNELLFYPNMPALEDVSIFNFSNDDEDDGIVADMNNLDTTIQVSPISTTRIYKDHPLDQVIRDLHSATQTRMMSKIEAIRLFLAYASFKDFMVYQIDVKLAFLYGKIEEEVYVCQPPGFKDPDFPDRVYKVEKALYGLHQALSAWFIKVKTTSTPMETPKPLLKDEDGEEVYNNL
uniref:Putative ribonuclease H-like domain-containing protein n=1 Tax=Tanacetum cinerariifolium TaxID=118510 RepID=A0A6L2J835_TANCI|nr:putative ribonuclease H-like domain-containing protein [Tanacetum cinerariifolium]